MESPQNPLKCECENAGFCRLLRRECDPSAGRLMSKVRHEECRTKPHYFEMFLGETKKPCLGHTPAEPPNLKTGTSETDWNEPSRCRHLGEEFDERECQLCGLKGTMYKVRKCAIHGECSERKRATSVQSCLACEEYAPREPPPKAPVEIQLARPQDFKKTEPIGGFLKTGCGRFVDGLQDSYRGASIFLMLGGPSLSQMPLEQLNQIGILSAACNNAATLYRPNLWFMVDPPHKFNYALWRDPGVQKFTMLADNRINGELRSHSKGNVVVNTGHFAWQCPNTFFVEVSSGFTVENFLDRPKPAWECELHDGKKRHVKRSVMLVALRMLYWLGFRTVFLLGADFHYRPEKTYAFPGCNKDASSCGSNNNTMHVLNQWFLKLRPEFERRGFRVYNATPGSRLTAFDLVEFSQAVEKVAWQKPLETRGLYGGT